MKLKTRTNQPVYYKLPVSSNIQSLSDDLLNSLRVGDVVQKKTGNQKHCYIVTYKEEKHGICLSHFACGYSETISYDYVGGHWVFNSKDVSEVPSLPSPSVADEGKVLGVNSSGAYALQDGGGTQLYKHTITGLTGGYEADIFSLQSVPFTTKAEMGLKFLFGRCGSRNDSGDLDCVIEYIITGGTSPKIAYHNTSGGSANISLADYTTVHDVVTKL